MINVKHFSRLPRPNNFSIEHLFLVIRRTIPSDIAITLETCPYYSSGIFRRILNIISAARRQGDVNHITGDVHYLCLLMNPKKTILTIHDCVTLDHSKGIRKWLIWLLWYWLPAKRCRYITTISNASRDRILSYIDFPPARLRVIPNPVNGNFQFSPKAFNAAEPNILFVGTGKNKNLSRCFAAIEAIKCRVTIIGRLSPSQLEEIKRYSLNAEQHNNLSEAEVIQHYREADLVVFASTYEGFGLPIIEAQATGRPVITSNLSPMPEVAGDGAVFVDPYDVSDIRAKVLSVISDDSLRQETIANGLRNVKRFEAKEIAQMYAELYRHAARISHESIASQ
jgi:glycosyltransferase involved in cell wall biosynthesis